jgi:hypothetical protein
MKAKAFFILTTAIAVPFSLNAEISQSRELDQVSDQLITQQRLHLEKNTENQGFGPQSPRDLNSVAGNNSINFSPAPASSEMNLCNIHFHKNAEHTGGEFTKYAGNGDGHGYLTGFQYSGQLTKSELAPLNQEVCPSKHGSLYPGDTIEVHYVHSTAQIQPGPTLGACFNDAIKNPQLRVEAQVYVLVNDSKAANFAQLTQLEIINGVHQVLNIPNNTGTPIQYAGSTTGPGYNEVGSPFQVSWSVRPQVTKVNIATVGDWCQGNVFKEDHGHGVRNLVTNPDLLSEISQ